ncbi:MAG: hypothetical protein VX012_10940 [Planctomycetota bacterium]|nr:hypothetical protein [Planctomycetota bacterium]
MKHHTSLPLIATLGLAAAASAEITGAYVVSYTVMTEDFGGTAVSVNVQDLYLSSDDAADTVLNVFTLDLVAAAQVTYFQSDYGPGWSRTQPGGPFTNGALEMADSFVTIGGVLQGTFQPEQTSGVEDGVGLDGDFGGNDAAFPGGGAGWFNGNTAAPTGQVGMVNRGDNAGFELGVLVGRFAYEGDFTLEGSTLWTTWNQGIGTAPVQAGFTVTPAPGALALFGLAGFALRRRRS